MTLFASTDCDGASVASSAGADRGPRDCSSVISQEGDRALLVSVDRKHWVFATLCVGQYVS